MNISKISNIYEAYTVGSANKINKKITNNIEEAYVPSEKAADFATTLNAVRNQPEIRTEKITSIKNEIDAGTYFVSASDIANKILGAYNG
ncbi:MAG: flagellar biosynthesis anti-sigma factor FlgM [Defluviitaleaceae bacterium]|nr:flagellar biosynthesis anti-sigma factor FlgM [Defluviitaleaceae bacterium]